MAPKQSSSSSRDLRHRVLTCVTKLSDRDTLRQAVAELESIIPILTGDTFSLFINSLSSTSTAGDRAAVRSASLHLLASLSSFHGRSLSPQLPKLIAAIVRRLRDPDSAVRSAAASTTASFAANITNSAFSSFLRPLSDSLATEQDNSAQSAAALCLSAAIDASPEPDIYQIVKLLPKWMKLLKCDSYKAKSALIALIRSSIRACEVGNCNLLRDMVVCLVEFLKSEDWMARKAAAEALKEAATVERDSLSELKASSLKTFESRKFDKVKAVREAITQMVEAWKEIPDVFDDESPPPQSQASSKENTSEGCYPHRFKISNAAESKTSQVIRKDASNRRSSPSDSTSKITAGNRGANVMNKRSNPLISRKLEFKKPFGRDIEAIDLHHSSVTPAYNDRVVEDEDVDMTIVRSSNPEAKRSLFSKTNGSRVAPSPKDDTEGTLVVNNAPMDVCRHHKDCEDLSLIRKQLVQIENQQSSLMDLLQKFIGSSQDGMHTLETRVHGLEMALNDISYDLAVSTARITTSEATRTSCWSLPSSDFLRSKFWRRHESHLGNTASTVYAMRNIASNRRVLVQGGGGIIVNPLAEIYGDSRRIPDTSSGRVLSGVHNVA